MSNEKQEENNNLTNEFNKNDNFDINNVNKKISKRRRKELIDDDNEEDEKIKDEFEIIQNEEIEEKNNLNKLNDEEIINNNNGNKYKTLEKEKGRNSNLKNNKMLQEKLKKIFLDREKTKLKYTKQEIPDYLKYHSDDSDSFESTGLRKSKLLKKENNIINIKDKNLKPNVSDKKSLPNNKLILEENNEKIKNNGSKKEINDLKNEEDKIKINESYNTDLNNKDFLEKNLIENKEIISDKSYPKNNDEIKKDLIGSYKEDLIQEEENKISNKNEIKIEELSPKNKNREIIELSPRLIAQKNICFNIESSSKENNSEIKDIKTIYNENELNIEVKNENQIKIETTKEENIIIKNEEDNKYNNLNQKNKLTIKTNQNEYSSKNNKNKKTNELFSIIEQLKKKQSESVSNKKNLEVIRFPKEQKINKGNNNINTEKNKVNNPQRNEINKERMKIKKNKNIDLNIFLTKKEPENIFQKNKEIQTIDLSPKNKFVNNSYSSKGIPHAKYNQDKNPNLLSSDKNSIPIPKTSDIYRIKNTPYENSLDIELNTTPSSHLDRSFDALNNLKQSSKINKGKNSLNVYRPKKVNNKKSKIKEKKSSEINAIIPNQNIIYNNFNNFFNSPDIYRNTNKVSYHKKNQKSFSEYSNDNENKIYINKENNYNSDLYLNQEGNNNSFDGYMNKNFDKRNNFNDNKYIYYGNNENKKMSKIAEYKHINLLEDDKINNNGNLVFNNLYKNQNNNKSLENIFTGYNNNIFDINYLDNENLGNFSSKNNAIQNSKFITYNILNSNPSYSNIPIRTILNTSNPENNYYQKQNINISPKRKFANKNANCIYNNRYNTNIYPNNIYYSNNVYNDRNNNFNNIQKTEYQPNKNKKTRNASINIEDLIVLEEKMSEIIIALNKNGIMHYECFEFWNYYYNCSLFGQLEKLFKTQNEQKNVQISINHILISIMICYDYSYEIEVLNGDYSLLDEILKLNHKILMIIYEHILSKISSESKSNTWVFKLRDLINDFNDRTNNDYFTNPSQMSSIEKIIYNTSAIVQNIRILLKNYKTKNIIYLFDIFKTISAKTYEEIDNYFRDYIFRVDNFNGSVLASVFLKENENFKTEPAPYIRTKNKKPFSLILDLDETLIHFKVNNDDDTEGVLQIRPGVIPFLERVGKFYELMVFTAATQDYGDLLIDAIEENKVYFEHRFYRQHTIIIGNDFVKDLRRIGRPLDKIIIVDNMPQNFRLQKENGINIKAFWGEDSDDNALEELGIILINIAIDGGDVRKGLEKYKDEIIRKVTSNISKNKF